MCYNEIDGNLVELVQRGFFDVIVNTGNCFNVSNDDRAHELVNTFELTLLPLEHGSMVGQITKLGMIDYETSTWEDDTAKQFDLTFVNAYTQFGPNDSSYDALGVCLKKINNIFQSKKIVMYKISNGDWGIISEIIKRELKDCCVTIIN